MLLAPLDASWWPQVAGHTLRLAGWCGLASRDLRRLTVLVPRMSDAPALRAALHAALGGEAAWFAPRIATLERWVGMNPAPQSQQLVELFEALRASAWAREAFGERPGALWALAGELAQLGDELTLAAVGGDESFEGRWRASVQRHFQRRAARAGTAQAQLVLQIWKAHGSDEFGAGALLRQWAMRAGAGDGPVLVLAPFGLPAWQQALLHGLEGRRPAWVVQGDLQAVLAARPWLALAWPELATPEPPWPEMSERGESARSEPAPALQIVSAATLEEEASAAAAQVVDWLAAGLNCIGLVALDRLAARRVRALLERAQIAVADQSGWKLSTTSAAAVVMRWLDLVMADFRIRDLLDWLRSPFALSGAPQRLALARLVDELARRHALAGSLAALRRVLARVQAGEPAMDPQAVPEQDLAYAGQALDRLAEQSRRLRGERGPGRLMAALSTALDQLGMREALARDPIGCDVLREIERLRCQLDGHTTPLSLGEFREMLAVHFENTNASDPGVDSPVVMTSLAGACLRPFDAALLIGVGADHLPSGGEPGVVMSSAVRRDLGLPTLADAHRMQQQQLAVLLGSVPRVTATWRRLDSDEPRALSPWLDRLRELAARAAWPDPVQRRRMPSRLVPVQEMARPAPSVSGRLPSRLSAGAYQSLVDCPYQFYARHLLGLRQRDLFDEIADRRDLGLALHSILHRFHQSHGDDAVSQMSDEAVEQALADVTIAHFGRDMKERPTLIAYRRRILDLMPGYVRWLRERAGLGWRLQRSESGFAAAFALDGAHTVELAGRVDRIDALADGSQEVIDYKARAHDVVRKTAADPGEQIQLPFYALALGPQVQGASYLSFERAPDAGRPSDTVRSAAVAPLLEWVPAIERRLRADLLRLLAGAPMPALGVEPACTYCEMRGLCRRAQWIEAPGR